MIYIYWQIFFQKKTKAVLNFGGTGLLSSLDADDVVVFRGCCDDSFDLLGLGLFVVVATAGGRALLGRNLDLVFVDGNDVVVRVNFLVLFPASVLGSVRIFAGPIAISLSCFLLLFF